MEISIDTTDLKWLAKLAHALLGESHAADDLVQDTVAVALQSPGIQPQKRRAWLGSVARNLAARYRRGEARRRQREHRAAQLEAQPDSADLVVKAEVAGQILAATKKLSEPHRSTILLHFLEGLTAKEMALREGRPVDTIRLRMRRGLDLLRTELLRRDDDWASWCSALAPLASQHAHTKIATTKLLASTISLVAPTIIMKSTLAIAAAGILVVGGAWLLAEPSPQTPSPSPAPELAEVPSPNSPAATESAVAVEPQRTEQVVRARVASTQEQPHSLTGRVTDPMGRPISGALIFLTATDRDREEVLTKTNSDAEGFFGFTQPELEAVAQDGRFDLHADAEGFLRTDLKRPMAKQIENGLLVVLQLGSELAGQVVDEYGRGIPNLELLAHLPRAGVDHVSPSQSGLRTERLRTSLPYFQSRQKTDENGMVTFGGLPRAEVQVRSLDPGWTIKSSTLAQTEGPFVAWSAERRLGVRLRVANSLTGKPVDLARATFRVELAFANGGTADYGQWVGRGEGTVSFTLGPDLPDLSKRIITSATFYGTVSANNAEVNWRAEPLVDPRGTTGVSEVDVAITPSMPSASREAWPLGALELDVRYADGTPVMKELNLDWRATADGNLQEGSANPQRLPSGRYSAQVHTGTVQLQVAESNASGSLQPWTGKATVRGGEPSLACVTLPQGGSVEILRPRDWTGEWFVHASWQPKDGEGWRGSWNYSTTQDRLELNALRSAAWRFQLRQGSEGAPDPLIREVVLEAGQRVSVSDTK